MLEGVGGAFKKRLNTTHCAESKKKKTNNLQWK